MNNEMNIVSNMIKSAMEEMANNGMIFSKEIQFQFALATELKKIKGAAVLLENLSVLKNDDGKDIKVYTDLVLQIDGFVYPIELKYKTADKIITYKDSRNGNCTYTFNQGAVESGSYDFIKDIKRIELLLDSDSEQSNYTSLGNNPTFNGGFAILLTNYDKYYQAKDDPFYWKNYHLNERTINKNTVLKWEKENKWGKISDEDFHDRLNKNLGKERANNPITLTRSYTFQWEDYSPLGWDEDRKGTTTHGFKYLLVPVQKNNH